MKRMWDLVLMFVVLGWGALSQLAPVCSIGITLVIGYVALYIIGRALVNREVRRRLTPKGVRELLTDYDTKSYSPGQALVKYLILSWSAIILFYDTSVLMGDWVHLVAALALLEIPLDLISRLTTRRRIVKRLKVVTRQFEEAGLLRKGPHDFEVKREIRI